MGVETFANVPAALITSIGVIYGAFVIVFFNVLELIEKKKPKGKELRASLIVRLVLAGAFVLTTWVVVLSVVNSISATEQIAILSDIPKNFSDPKYLGVQESANRAYTTAAASYSSALFVCGSYVIILALMRMLLPAEGLWRKLLPKRWQQFKLRDFVSGKRKPD